MLLVAPLRVVPGRPKFFSRSLKLTRAVCPEILLLFAWRDKVSEEADLVGGRLGLESASVDPSRSQVAVAQAHSLAVRVDLNRE